MLDFSKTDFFFDNRKKYVNGLDFNEAKKDILDYAQFGFHLSSAKIPIDLLCALLIG